MDVQVDANYYQCYPPSFSTDTVPLFPLPIPCRISYMNHLKTGGGLPMG
jgi:hypothetical protein